MPSAYLLYVCIMKQNRLYECVFLQKKFLNALARATIFYLCTNLNIYEKCAKFTSLWMTTYHNDAIMRKLNTVTSWKKCKNFYSLSGNWGKADFTWVDFLWSCPVNCNPALCGYAFGPYRYASNVPQFNWGLKIMVVWADLRIK